MSGLGRAVPEKLWVRRSFGRAAAHYDHYAALQRRVGRLLLDRLAVPREAVRVAVDVGSGTGYFLPELALRFPVARVVALDLAEEMLRAGRQRKSDGGFVCGDAEALPLADGCADLIYSNLALQWCERLGRALAEFRRVLRPGGVAAFTLFGPQTLQELRRAWLAVDAYTRVNDFVEYEAVREQLSRVGLQEIEMTEWLDRVAYASVPDLMRELKGLGAHNVSDGRARHCTGKSALQRMLAAYEAQMADGVIRATYQTIGLVVRKS